MLVQYNASLAAEFLFPHQVTAQLQYLANMMRDVGFYLSGDHACQETTTTEKDQKSWSMFWCTQALQLSCPSYMPNDMIKYLLQPVVEDKCDMSNSTFQYLHIKLRLWSKALSSNSWSNLKPCHLVKSLLVIPETWRCNTEEDKNSRFAYASCS